MRRFRRHPRPGSSASSPCRQLALPDLARRIANDGFDSALPPWQDGRVATVLENPLDELIVAAGFATKKAFAEAAGLADYEISRIGLGPKHRRPTSLQIRKIATALQKRPSDIAALLLPEDDLEHEVATSAIRERDTFITDLSKVRAELVALRTQLAEARSQVTSLGHDLSRLQAEKERLLEELGQERDRASRLDGRHRELQREKIALEHEKQELRRQVGEARNQVVATKAEMAHEWSRVYGQLQNELGRERAAGVQRQILAGSFGMLVGAIVGGAASSGGKKNPKNPSRG
jgi:predicted  nucleic acid-binding Zn-ribbon protein